MARIVFLIRSLGSGGSERQLSTLARALDKEYFDVTVISFYSGGSFEKELKENNIRLVCLSKRGRWDVLSFLWRLIGELRKLHPDILHSYLVEPNLLVVLLKPFFRPTRVVWGLRASNMELEHYDWLARLNFRLQCLASRFADLIIANSESGRDYHVSQGFPPEKCIVVHSGIDIEEFKPDPASGRRVRAAWGVPDGRILIGQVARFDPMKDQPGFLKAAELLSRERDDVRFVSVGGGSNDYAATLRQLAKEYGIADRMIWAGARDDMPAVYNALDIVCSSSLSEGLPNAIAEAMACGVPCVVTDVGDSAFLVGNTGIVVPPNDPRALANGLKECLDNLSIMRGERPRSRIEERFGLSRLRDETQAALKALKPNRRGKV